MDSKNPWDVVELTRVIFSLWLSTFLLALTVIILVLLKPQSCVFNVLLTHSPWLSLALAAVWKTWAGGGGRFPRLASQLARTTTKTLVRRRAAPSVKNSLSPNVTAWWSEPCAPRLSLSMQRVDPEHHSRAYSRLADFVVSQTAMPALVEPPGPRPPSGQLGAASLVFGMASQNRLARYLHSSPMLTTETSAASPSRRSFTCTQCDKAAVFDTSSVR